MEEEMRKEYQSPQWREKRERIFRRDQYTCLSCGRKKSESVILQVHHPCYVPGCHVWEYPDSILETICKRCHASKHLKVLPKTGWTYEEQYDTEDYGSEQCELCGTDLRYVHILGHPDYGTIKVGCDCADTLLNNHDASEKEKEREARARKYQKYWDSPKWKQRKNGYFYKNNVGKIEIWNNGGRYKLCYQLNDDYDEDLRGCPKYTKGTFPSLTEAKRAGFEILYPQEDFSAPFTYRTRVSLPNNPETARRIISNMIIEELKTTKTICLPDYKSIKRRLISIDDVLQKGICQLKYDFAVSLKGRDGKIYCFYYKVLLGDDLLEEEILNIQKSGLHYLAIDCHDLYETKNISQYVITNALDNYRKFSWINAPVYEELLKKKAR